MSGPQVDMIAQQHASPIVAPNMPAVLTSEGAVGAEVAIERCAGDVPQLERVVRRGADHVAAAHEPHVRHRLAVAADHRQRHLQEDV